MTATGNTINTHDGRTISNTATASFDRPATATVTANGNPIRTRDGRIITNQATADFDNPDYPRVSEAGRKIITDSESFGATPYVPMSSASSGVTIGYGYDIGRRTSSAAKDELMAAGVSAATAMALSAGAGLRGGRARTFIADTKAAITITPSQADYLFQNEVHVHAKGALKAINVPLAQNQFDALVSLHYNYPRAVREDVGPLINEGRFAEAADAFGKYIYGSQIDPKTGKTIKVVQGGLVDRRAAEKKLFLGQ